MILLCWSVMYLQLMMGGTSQLGFGQIEILCDDLIADVSGILNLDTIIRKCVCGRSYELSIEFYERFHEHFSTLRAGMVTFFTRPWKTCSLQIIVSMFC